MKYKNTMDMITIIATLSILCEALDKFMELTQ